MRYPTPSRRALRRYYGPLEALVAFKPPPTPLTTAMCVHKPTIGDLGKIGWIHKNAEKGEKRQAESKVEGSIRVAGWEVAAGWGDGGFAVHLPWIVSSRGAPHSTIWVMGG